jgi:hypothetical protein
MSRINAFTIDVSNEYDVAVFEPTYLMDWAGFEPQKIQTQLNAKSEHVYASRRQNYESMQKSIHTS